VSPWLQAALGGVAGAALWAAQEPLDQRVFRFPYSDVAILGRLATAGPGWRPIGAAMHLVNGAAAGLVFWAAHEWLGGSVFWGAIVFALVEHVLTYPLALLTDRFHPARGAPELPPLTGSGRAFAQATWRHLLFGVVLGLVASV
jgi:hypothetical protein